MTSSETEALIEGQLHREETSWRQTRLIAVLLRNAHFEGPVTESEFLPLPGDEIDSPEPGRAPRKGGMPSHHFLTMLVGRQPTVITPDEPVADRRD